MAHFVPIKAPAGSWIGVTNITPADMTAFDQRLAKALNGDDGGVWAPTEPIVIGGAGLQATFVDDSYFQSGASLHMLAGSALILEPGAEFVYPDRLVRQVSNVWRGGGAATWTGASFGGGALQLVADLPFADFGIEVGDEVHFSVDFTALMHPSTQAWLRLSAGEDTSYFVTTAIDAGGSTGLTGSNVPGECIVGPFFYDADFTLPVYRPVAMRAKYIVQGGADNHVYLAVSAKVQPYDGSAVPQITLDQGLAGLSDAVFSYAAQIWRPG